MVRLSDIIQNRNTDPEDEKRKKSKPEEETPYPAEEQANEEAPLRFLPEGAMRSAPPDAGQREEKTVDEEAEVSFSDFTPLPVPHPGGRKKGPGSDRPVRETGSLRSPTKLDVKQRHLPLPGWQVEPGGGDGLPRAAKRVLRERNRGEKTSPDRHASLHHHSGPAAEGVLPGHLLALSPLQGKRGRRVTAPALPPPRPAGRAGPKCRIAGDEIESRPA